jgi:hypothetical protein
VILNSSRYVKLYRKLNILWLDIIFDNNSNFAEQITRRETDIAKATEYSLITPTTALPRRC